MTRFDLKSYKERLRLLSAIGLDLGQLFFVAILNCAIESKVRN